MPAHTGLAAGLEEMVQLVHFAERAGGKLATFTLNLTANVSRTKVPCCAVFFISLSASRCRGAFRHRVCQLVQAQ